MPKCYCGDYFFKIYRRSHQTRGTNTTHCPILLLCLFMCSSVCASLLPIHKRFCVGVCQQCCLQAGPHCVEPLLLIDTGPLALHVPMAPQAMADGRLKPEPPTWGQFVCAPLSLHGCPCSLSSALELVQNGAKMCDLCTWRLFRFCADRPGLQGEALHQPSL